MSPSGDGVCYYSAVHSKCFLGLSQWEGQLNIVTGSIYCWYEALSGKWTASRELTPSFWQTARQLCTMITQGGCIFQIYLTSILHTYKVSIKLQNIYYQEGIIMLQSRDKTICRTQKHCRASFLSCAPTFFTVMDTKRYHTSVPRKAKI